jgi:hypothetical protein
MISACPDVVMIKNCGGNMNDNPVHKAKFAPKIINRKIDLKFRILIDNSEIAIEENNEKEYIKL